MKKIPAILSSMIALQGLAAEQAPDYSDNRNLYFGDTHVHTALSFDSYIFASRLGLEDAYRFARGEGLTLPNGATVKLTRPLDFVVLADHAESFGLFETCAEDGLSESQQAYCAQFDAPTRQTFLKIREEAQSRPPKRMPGLCENDMENCLANARTTWDRIRAAADAHNDPGAFSAFAGYEYSPLLPKAGKVHRVVIFKNSVTPDRAVSAFDAETVLDLWRDLESECRGDCEFLTIPHNMNKSWGVIYGGVTIDGDPFQPDDWASSRRNEPLAEIFQIKGSSECGYGLGANDEECNFELIVPLCEDEQVAGCSGPKSFVRQGLKKGLELEGELGFNPLQVGVIGSTDTHYSLAGDTEETDFVGSNASHGTAQSRLGLNDDKTKRSGGNPEVPRRNPGGLAAVWARENTREAIFDAMRNRETYATSGTRIKLRFFAGWNLDKELLHSPDLVGKAYAGGVPMGGVLSKHTDDQSPDFLVWAMKDSMSANLQKVQMIKGWVENGESKEIVLDIACSDGLIPGPVSGRCPDNDASIDAKTCDFSQDKGDREIKVRWRDPDFSPDQSAFYYVRVLENPTCRWSTFDAISLGINVPEGLPLAIQERAWSSPIWFTP